MKRTLLLVTLLGLPLASANLLADGTPATPSIEQLWNIIQAQQAEINAPEAEAGGHRSNGFGC